jgi:hypothetical protein
MPLHKLHKTLAHHRADAARKETLDEGCLRGPAPQTCEGEHPGLVARARRPPRPWRVCPAPALSPPSAPPRASPRPRPGPARPISSPWVMACASSAGASWSCPARCWSRRMASWSIRMAGLCRRADVPWSDWRRSSDNGWRRAWRDLTPMCLTCRPTCLTMAVPRSPCSAQSACLASIRGSQTPCPWR